MHNQRARWHLVPANNKPFARLAALSILADQLGKGISLGPRALDAKTATAASLLFPSPRQSDFPLPSGSNISRPRQDSSE
jgi:hypothetical protein